jgi:transglutaminase-like putative cysteine protease
VDEPAAACGRIAAREARYDGRMSITRFRVSRLTKPLIVALSVVLAVAATGLSGADAPSRLRIGKPHRLRVTHTTRVRVDEGTARLRVWQAKPLIREWPGLKSALGVEKTTFSPTGAKEVPTHSEGGFAWAWEISDPAVGPVDCASTFEVTSADRDLNTSGLVVRWADLPKDTTEMMKGLPALPTPNDTLREAVAKIKKKGKDVIDGLTAFTQWVSSNIAYAPGVSYGTNDVDAICKGGGGHCGHRATIFLALCQAAGIPARRVSGYALLNHPTGGVGVDDSNRHVWVEVNLPGLGWVEVEPAPHGSPFALSYLFVMCPSDLQSRFVAAVSKAGAETSPVLADTLRMEELK